MKVVVGLGNPGQKYIYTRHNVGFIMLEHLVGQMTKSKFQISNQDQISNFQMNRKFKAEMAQEGELLLVKPQSYMNKSGVAVQKIIQFYKVDLKDLWVIHDDLDIRLGEYKIQLGKGPKVHNGVNSIERALGISEFWRVRVGIDSRLQMTDDRKMSGEDYVLGKFSNGEKQILNRVMDEVTDELVSRYL